MYVLLFVSFLNESKKYRLAITTYKKVFHGELRNEGLLISYCIRMQAKQEFGENRIRDKVLEWKNKIRDRVLWEERKHHEEVLRHCQQEPVYFWKLNTKLG